MNTQEFLRFKEKFNKKYKNPTEEYHSFQNFNHNCELIRFKNSKVSSYKLGINQFSDKTMEYLQGNLLSSNFYDQDSHVPSLLFGKDDNLIKRKNKVFNSIDWTEKGFVSRVKNQGACGSCWAFSTTGALESMIHINKGIKMELSEQELINCSVQNFGCKGGWMHKAFDYVISKKGLFSGLDYPYKENHDVCDENLIDTKRISESGDFDYLVLPTDSVDSMKHAIMINPICAAVRADFDFVYYEDGIFDQSIVKNPKVNHAILITGFDQNKNIWRLKNSWGTSWGQHGYMDISIKEKSGVTGINSYCIVPLYVGQD